MTMFHAFFLQVDLDERVGDNDIQHDNSDNDIHYDFSDNDIDNNFENSNANVLSPTNYVQVVQLLFHVVCLC